MNRFLSHVSYSSSLVHRDLHSFPTRRSSDLRQTSHQKSHKIPAPMLFDLSPELDAGFRALRLRPWRRGLQTAPDRKSTRLNSSHANISYAVFCLKKKKKSN